MSGTAFADTPAVPAARPASGGADLRAMLADALSASPARPAFRHGGRCCTVGELARLSHDAARLLGGRGLRPGELVGIEIEHGIDLVASLCGVLLAGGCAVPIDPGVAAARREAILEDTDPRFVFRQGRRLDERGGAAPTAPGLAFVVYTSGSSGGPKGVAIADDAYAARMAAILRAPGEDEVDLVWTPSSFVGMLDEVFYPLLCGMPAVIAAPRVRTDPQAFAALVRDEGVTAFRATPSLLDVLVRSGVGADLQGVRALYSSGEALSADVQARLRNALPAQVVGFYGATEAPGAAFHAYDRDAPPLRGTVCAPQAFCAVRIVDGEGRSVGVGVTGEIWIGGETIARGYWNKPALTAEKFVEAEGGRWYRTGDQGRWLDEARFEVLGRADRSEANVQGARVNLAEATEAIRALPGVRDGWISVVRSGDGAAVTLVGHCAADGPLDEAAAREALARTLPSAAVPRRLLRHGAFPLTDNGKTDAQRLEASARAALAPRADARGPGSALSGDAATILPVVLRAAAAHLDGACPGPADNFFDLGGNSLSAVGFALALGERLGVDVRTTLVFNTNDFAEIAEAVASGQGHEAPALRVLREGGGEGPPLFTVNAAGNYAALAPRLGGRYPVASLSIFGLTNEFADALETVTLDDIASRFAAQILAYDPEGPWRLLAYCQDGAVAVETARHLNARGGRCDLVLIDTFFTAHRTSLAMLVRRTVELGPQHHWRRARAKLFGRRPVRVEDISPERKAAMMAKSRADQRFYRRYTELFSAYEPEPFGGGVSLLVSRDWRHADLACVEAMAEDRLSVTRLRALHATLFSPDALADLARAVDAAVDRKW